MFMGKIQREKKKIRYRKKNLNTNFQLSNKVYNKCFTTNMFTFVKLLKRFWFITEQLNSYKQTSAFAAQFPKNKTPSAKSSSSKLYKKDPVSILLSKNE